MERVKIGEVFHYFTKIGVAAIRLTDGAIAVGDRVVIQGPTTNLEQPVDALQIEHMTVSSARQGQEVGMKVQDRVREHDFVYKLVETEVPPPTAPPPRPEAAPEAKAPPRRKPSQKRKPSPKRKPSQKRKPSPKRKAPRKRKTPRKKKPPVRKASRATRSKGRRGFRKSRRRSR